MKHYAPTYFQRPQHAITIDLVGVGGTGSQVLTGLARINQALRGLGHPGLHVTAYDPDKVSLSNMGRQLFSYSDIGMNKAMVLVTRINRFFGTEWLAVDSIYSSPVRANMLVTCIDTAAGRVAIAKNLKHDISINTQPFNRAYYWLDLGNSDKKGQVVLGTINAIPQPEKTARRTMPHVVKQFPELKKLKEEDQGPSCSLAEALERQDLFINSTLAQFGCNLIWKLIREGSVSFRGCYLNLDQLTVNPIKI